MEINEYAFLDSFKDFFPEYMPLTLFVLCYLLFKSKPSKTNYAHLFIVIVIVASKHWVSMLYLFKQAKELGIELHKNYVMIEYFNQSFFTGIFAIAILALLYRPNDVGYDKILKKEIWGVWAKENNSTDYFDARERKLNTQGVKDNEQ